MHVPHRLLVSRFGSKLVVEVGLAEEVGHRGISILALSGHLCFLPLLHTLAILVFYLASGPELWSQLTLT